MNKKDIISEKTLLESLERIKETLNKISAEEAKKIVFLNLMGLFHYITDMNYTDAEGKNNIKNLFDTVSPYIPVSITEENLARALKDTLTKTPEEQKRIDESFITYSKIRFLNRVSVANEAEWENIKSLCATIRDIVEDAASTRFQ